MLIEQSQNNGLAVVDTVIGDAAYSGKKNLELAKEKNIQIVSKLNSVLSQGTRKKEDEFDYNKDANIFVCPLGHMAVREAIKDRKNVGENRAVTYYFDKEKCKKCP